MIGHDDVISASVQQLFYSFHIIAQYRYEYIGVWRKINGEILWGKASQISCAFEQRIRQIHTAGHQSVMLTFSSD